MAHRCCDDFSRTRDPKAPPPAGRGLDRRQFMMRSAGLLMTVYGATRLPIAALQEGVARRRTAGQGARVGIHGGRHRLAVGARSGR